MHLSQPRQSGCYLCFWQYRISLENGDFRYSLIPSLWWSGFKSLCICNVWKCDSNKKNSNQNKKPKIQEDWRTIQNCAHMDQEHFIRITRMKWSEIIRHRNATRTFPYTYMDMQFANSDNQIHWSKAVEKLTWLTSLWAAQYFISHGMQYTLAVLCGFPFLAQVSQKVGFSRADGRSATDKSVCALK